MNGEELNMLDQDMGNTDKRRIPFGPTYDEMLHPDHQPPDIRSKALAAFERDELDPINLFNIHWREPDGQVRRIVLPKELTGVDANIVVMTGDAFPSGSHKVGPAYATLIEGCIDGSIQPGVHTILGPSTGNFGIGVAYISRLMGYRAVVIMPDNMSRERYERIRKYGAELELTPGTESDVILTLQKTHEMAKNPSNKPLAQFELMPNYRFHRHVTGLSAVDAVRGIGNSRVAAFCTAPGSAGTLAAGDALKSVFPECRIVAIEPNECSTLANGQRGQHRIEGIGDKMCTLIHNVRNTDFIILIHDEDCVKALKVIQDAPHIVAAMGVERDQAASLRNRFGVSGMCNVLGAIRMARFLRLGPDDNVVTIATDGFDRYPSVLADLERRTLEINDHVLSQWARELFLADCCERNGEVHDLRLPERKEPLYHRKEMDWMPFGYSPYLLNAMRSAAWWDEEYAKIPEIDRRILEMR